MAKPLTLISSSIRTDANIGLSAEDKADYVTAFMDEGKKYSVSWHLFASELQIDRIDVLEQGRSQWLNS
jgi:hypothetical protein